MSADEAVNGLLAINQEMADLRVKRLSLLERVRRIDERLSELQSSKSVFYLALNEMSGDNGL